MQCSRPNCDKPQQHLGRCELHYRKYLRNGGKRIKLLVDPTLAVAHIDHLRSHRWTYAQIGKAAGLPHSAIASVHNGRYKKISEKNLNAILSVPGVEETVVTPLGFERRVRALAWMGWTRDLIAQDMGVSEFGLSTALGQSRFSPAFGRKLLATYDRLWNVEGPSSRSRLIARNRGWAPPAAWDDDTIDTAPELDNFMFVNQPVRRGPPRKAHCPRGHAMKGRNVVVRSGYRACRECRNLNDRERRNRNKKVS